MAIPKGANENQVRKQARGWASSYAITSERSAQQLKSGGDGGNNGGMDARVAKLESQFEKLNEKVDQLRIDTAVLKEKVSNLPGKGFIVTATVSALALFSALILFKEKIALLIG